MRLADRREQHREKKDRQKCRQLDEDVENSALCAKQAIQPNNVARHRIGSWRISARNAVGRGRGISTSSSGSMSRLSPYRLAATFLASRTDFRDHCGGNVVGNLLGGRRSRL
jgi:hypothetical protein